MATERNRAWRRHQNRRHRGKQSTCPADKLPKQWKYLYFRSNKMKRARQLGFEYPRKSEREILEQALDEASFICL